jgi:hypothetical protein
LRVVPVSRIATALVIFLFGSASPALSADDSGQRWGLSIWGLSYHIDDDADFDEANVGVGIRYYFNRRLFAEVDALRNSNGGLAVPLSAGLDFRVAAFGESCAVYAVVAGTVVYYQNRRSGVDYVKAGPVPGVTFGCGRVRTNAIVVLRGKSQPVAAIAASLTIMLR